MGHVARSRIIALDVVLRPAALGDDLAALQEGVAHVDGLVEQAAGVGAQVDDIAERLAASRLVDRQKRRLGSVTRVPGERVDVDDADAVLDLPLHRAELDPLTDDRDIERLVTPGADDAQLDVGSGRALHLLDGLVEAQAVEKLAVDVGDIVAGLDPGAPCGRVLHRGDDLHRAVLDADRDPEAAVIAVGRGLQHIEVGRLDEARMWVERGEHAVDRALDERMVVDLVDILGFHPLVDAHERLELLVVGRVRSGQRARRHRYQRERSCKGERREQFASQLHGLHVPGVRSSS
jgi:hypothetical protein